jgi:hypothetical protein
MGARQRFAGENWMSGICETGGQMYLLPFLQRLTLWHKQQPQQ